MKRQEEFTVYDNFDLQDTLDCETKSLNDLEFIQNQMGFYYHWIGGVLNVFRTEDEERFIPQYRYSGIIPIDNGYQR